MTVLLTRLRERRSRGLSQLTRSHSSGDRHWRHARNRDQPPGPISV